MKPTTKAAMIGFGWIAFLIIMMFLTSCASNTPDTIYAPAPVDMPVSVPCKTTPVVKPQDLLVQLPVTATLTQTIKSCLAQYQYDLGYQSQLEAALTACQ